MRCVVPVVQPCTADGNAGEGLEAPFLGGSVSGREEDPHRADERRDERSRHLRSRLTFDEGAAGRIR
jgi:hypothetical protein